MCMDFNSLTNVTCLFNRLDKFKASLMKVFSAAHAQSLPLVQVKESVNKGHPDAKFGEKEFGAALQIMQEANQIYEADGHVFLI